MLTVIGVALPSSLLLFGPTAMRFDVFLVGWSGMVGALMVPTLEPFLALYAGMHPSRSPLFRMTRQLLAVAPFGVIWIATGAIAWTLFTWAEGESVARGLLVAAAGSYQLSPLARACLGRCRSPMAFLMRYGGTHRGAKGALTLGARYAGICVGCCAGLWIALVGAGAMALTWMTALALLVLVEKWHPRGDAFRAISGAMLLGLAVPTAFGAEVWAEQIGAMAMLGTVIAAAATFRSQTAIAERSGGRT